jgi:hypothetical protein
MGFTRGYSPSHSQPNPSNFIKNMNERERRARMKLADKIVMVMIDRINQVVVRPGPDPEERECYDMAKEIRDISPDLASLVAKVLKVHEEES